MEGFHLPKVSSDVKEIVNTTESVSKPASEPALNAHVPPLRREQDSLDDFEHLEHESSPGNQTWIEKGEPAVIPTDTTAPTRATDDHFTAIDNTNIENTGAARNRSDAVGAASETLETLRDFPEKIADKLDNLIGSFVDENKSESVPARSSLDIGGVLNKEDHILAMGDVVKSAQPVVDLIEEFPFAPPVPPHSEEFADKRAASQLLMDMEREYQPAPAAAVTKLSVEHLAEKFSDSEPEADEFSVPSSLPKEPEEAKHSDINLHKNEVFQDVYDEIKPKDTVEPKAAPPRTVAPKPDTKPDVPISVRQVPAPPKHKSSEQTDTEVIAAEAMFCQMGLDAWFNPERLNPKVESLVYWRDPRKSGAVFGGGLAVLLALSCFSLISVLAYVSLIALSGTMAFRIYKTVLQAVQKTSEGHPFKDLLELELVLPQDKVQQVSTVAVAHLNAAVSELRRLFLVEDFVDSIKFGVLLWCLTYLGAWFNGMTLIIIGFVALFTLPKVYETNKTQIDANLAVVRSKLQELTSKVKAAVPIGKKTPVVESEKDK